MNKQIESSLEFVQDDLKTIFEKMNLVLAHHNKKLDLVIIGSAVLITEGLPGRGTTDIDIWKTWRIEEDRWIKILSEDCELPIDPPYADPQVPHLSLVINDFIGFPDYAAWENDTEPFWGGSHLTLLRPPVGIMLGSKIAAWRGKDFKDVDWILDHYPDWKPSLDRYYPLFSKHTRQQIDKNRYLFDFHVDLKKSKTLDHPEVCANLILPRKTPAP